MNRENVMTQWNRQLAGITTITNGILWLNYQRQSIILFAGPKFQNTTRTSKQIEWRKEQINLYQDPDRWIFHVSKSYKITSFRWFNRRQTIFLAAIVTRGYEKTEFLRKYTTITETLGWQVSFEKNKLSRSPTSKGEHDKQMMGRNRTATNSLEIDSSREPKRRKNMIWNALSRLNWFLKDSITNNGSWSDGFQRLVIKVYNDE